MRRVTLFLSVLAIAALAASFAQATTFYDWEYIDTSEGAVNTTNPHATTEGSVWINTGSGPTLIQQDVNVQLLVNAPTVGWTPLIGSPLNGAPISSGTPTTSTLLLSSAYDSYTGGSTALGDITDFPDQGIFDANGVGYAVPDTTTPGTFQFQLLVWTGLYTSYAAAEASHTLGVYACAGGVFTDGIDYGPSPPGLGSGWIDNSPAMILQQVPVPEPSALLLVACGLVGLLAYAWRKRR
jgi:hypothetical protein